MEAFATILPFFDSTPSMKKAGITRGPFRTRHILSEGQARRQQRSTGRHFAETEPGINLDTSMSYRQTALLTFLRDDIFVRAFHQMLVYGNTGRDTSISLKEHNPRPHFVEVLILLRERVIEAISPFPLSACNHRPSMCVYSALYTDLHFSRTRSHERTRETLLPLAVLEVHVFP